MSKKQDAGYDSANSKLGGFFFCEMINFGKIA